MSAKTTPEDLLNATGFQIMFQGAPQVRTTSVSSAYLKSFGGGTISSISLKVLRKLGKLPQSYLFCITDANTVEDSTTLGHYIPLIRENVTALTKAAASSTFALLTVQYTSSHRSPDQIPKSPSPDGDNPSVAHNTATAGLVTGSGKVIFTHPAEMTGQEWNYVMVTNSLLHGMFFDITSNTLLKAREPAFKLKESIPSRFHSPAGSNNISSSDQPFSIPAFEINDETSVTITEVKSTLQLSMAQNAFSSSSIEASASIGIGPVSAGPSASIGWSSSTSSTLNKGNGVDCLHASYNFPRVKVFLDADDLVITDDCKALLKDIKTHKKPEDLMSFYRKYGHVFAGSIQLGGRLHATKDSSTFTTKDIREKKNAMKVAAGVSISIPSFSSSFSASHANDKDSADDKTSDKGSESLTWEAQGGETLLGSNPPVWIATVGSFYNWRVIERSNVHNILSFLKDISNKKDEDWPTIFSDIEDAQTRDALAFHRKSTRPDEIRIDNEGNTVIHVAVSNATVSNATSSKPEVSTNFFVIRPNHSRTWPRAGSECVFINGGGFGRVAIAMAKPGIYRIEKLDYDDPNIRYVNNDDDKVGVVNETDSDIQVTVTKSGGLEKFDHVHPGSTKRWTLSDSELRFETIFVKHSSSDVLRTYLGVRGYDLKVYKPGPPSLPFFRLVQVQSRTCEIRVINEQSYELNAKVSSATNPLGNVRFCHIRSGASETWDRDGPEVIYLNGPRGTAVQTYYGCG